MLDSHDSRLPEFPVPTVETAGNRDEDHPRRLAPDCPSGPGTRHWGPAAPYGRGQVAWMCDYWTANSKMIPKAGMKE